MKTRLLRVLLLLPLLSLIFALPSYAADGPLTDLIASLPDDFVDLLLEELGQETKDEALASRLSSLDAPFFLSLIEKVAKDALSSCLGGLPALFATLLLAALLRAVAGGASQTVTTVLGYASGLGVLLSLFELIKPLWEETAATLDGIGVILTNAWPIVTGLCLTSGGVNTASVSAAWLTALLTLLEELSLHLLSPLFSVYFGFLVVSAVASSSEGPDMSPFLQSFRRLITLMLSVFATLLGVLTSYQTVLAGRSDSMLLRGLKFASGNFVPIVGATLNEAASTALASFSFIKSACGTLTALSLLFFTLPLLFKLLFFRLALGCASGLALLLNCPKESKILKDGAGLLELAVALLAISSLVFLLVLGVFAATALA